MNECSCPYSDCHTASDSQADKSAIVCVSQGLDTVGDKGWVLPWKRKRLRLRVPILVSASGLIGGAMVLLSKWLYVHPSNPAIGAVLSLMADFVPMAIATVGIIMSYRPPKREQHLRTTLILVVCGFVGTGILSLARIRGEAAHKLEVDGLNEKLQFVGNQNTQILNGLTASKGTTPPVPAQTPPLTEAGRRRNVLALLRNEYILSHNKLSPALLSGAEQPPTEWINARLKELNEKWTVQGPQKPDTIIRIVHPKAPAMQVFTHSAVAANAEATPVLFDLDTLDAKGTSLNIKPVKYEWIRLDQVGGPTALVDEGTVKLDIGYSDSSR